MGQQDGHTLRLMQGSVDLRLRRNTVPASHADEPQAGPCKTPYRRKGSTALYYCIVPVP
jgi:hypothetical protein